ncbi:hypothetical protein EBZ80_12515 [bacterium]|nr:hypothetical protein [bacterium]
MRRVGRIRGKVLVNILEDGCEETVGFRTLAWKGTNHSRRDFKRFTTPTGVVLERSRCTGGKTDPCKWMYFRKGEKARTARYDLDDY